MSRNKVRANVARPWLRGQLDECCWDAFRGPAVTTFRICHPAVGRPGFLGVPVWTYQLAGVSVERIEADMASFLKRVDLKGKATSKTVSAVDADMSKKCPALVEYMTALVGPDGETRKPASLVVFAEDGAWKACLSDRHAGVQVWAAGETLLKCLGSLEGLLTAPETPWRPIKEYGPKKK